MVGFVTVIRKGFAMKFRTVAVSTLWVALFVSTFMALRAADPKAKAKDEDAVPPAPAAAPGTIKFTAAPPAVQKTFAAESRNSKIELLGKAEDGSFYQAIVGIGNPATNNYLIAVAKDGQLLRKILEPFRVDVKLEECPAPVQKALQNEVKGAKVEESFKATAAKQVEFVFTVSTKDAAYQLVFMEDGTLLSKVFLDDDQTPPGGNEKPEAPAEKPAKKGK